MTVAELRAELAEFDDDAEVVILRATALRRWPDSIGRVYSGMEFSDYDREFVGKVVIW
jgi:hypothetical protein